MQAEDDVMKSCSRFYEIMNECKAKGLLSFNKEVKNKHFGY